MTRASTSPSSAATRCSGRPAGRTTTARSSPTRRRTTTRRSIPSRPWTGTWRDRASVQPPGRSARERADRHDLHRQLRLRPRSRCRPTTASCASGGAPRWPRSCQAASRRSPMTASATSGTRTSTTGRGRPGSIRLSSTTVSGVDKLQDFGSTYATGHRDPPPDALSRRERRLPDALVFGGGTVQWSWGLDATTTAAARRRTPSMQQATVNLFADMAVQPRTLQAGLVGGQRVDRRGAADARRSPHPPRARRSSSASPVTIEGTAADAGGRVGAVEVSVDNGVSWHPATGRETWSYAWTPTAPGPVTVRVRAADDSGNLSAASAGPTVTVTGAAARARCSARTRPASTTENDGVPIEVGVRFRSDEAGTITALRYYKGAGWTGTRIGPPVVRRRHAAGDRQFTGESALRLAAGAAVPAGPHRREHDVRRLLLLEQRLLRARPRLLHARVRRRAAARAGQRYAERRLPLWRRLPDQPPTRQLLGRRRVRARRRDAAGASARSRRPTAAPASPRRPR